MAERYYAECHMKAFHAECLYTECRGAKNNNM